jgi:acetyl esterase
MATLNPTLAAIFQTPEMLEVKTRDVKQQRVYFNDRANTLFKITEKPEVEVENIIIPLTGRDIPARIYTPQAVTTDGAIIFYHGGGWMLHNLDVYQLFCFYLADQTKCKVVSVEYRLAPEHPFPEGVNDGIESMQWFIENIDNFGINSSKLIIAGDSGGDNIATVACHELSKSHKQPIAQVLLYPAVDLSKVYPSQELFQTQEYSLSKDWLQMMFDHYFTNPKREVFNPKASPILYKDFYVQPDCLLVIADFDPLRDEGIAYGEKLAQSGVNVECVHYPTMPHGFATFIKIVDEAEDVINKIAVFCQKKFTE